jgi:hypothetical protein
MPLSSNCAAPRKNDWYNKTYLHEFGQVIQA